jgi:hypothetical protein
MTTFYDILGVAPTASTDDIKRAYRHLAMQFHPDKTPGASKAVQRLIEDKFKEVQEAYDTLKDTAKRAEYDAALAMLRSEEYYEPPPPPPPPPPQKRQFCPKCGKPLPTWATSTDKFCGYCGASLKSPPPPPKQQEQDPQSPPPPPQTRSAQQNTRGLSNNILGLVIATGLIWAGIAGAIGGLFPNITDGAELASSLFLTAAPLVLWACVTKARMKWPMPALAPFLIFLFMAAAIISTGQKEISHHPSAPASAVRPQTAEASTTKVQSPIQTVPPQPDNRSASASRGHTASVSAHEPGCAVSEEAKKLGFVPDSCTSGQTWVNVVKSRSSNKRADVEASTTANQPLPTPALPPQTSVPLASSPSSLGVLHARVAGTPKQSDPHPPYAGEPQDRKQPAEPTLSALPAGFFTVGSSKADVLRAHGTPTSFTDREWSYGYSNVYFNDGRVVSWYNSVVNPLKARMLRPEP